MVRNTAFMAHQQEGAPCGIRNNKVDYPKPKGKIGDGPIRPSNSRFLHKVSGRDKISQIIASDNGPSINDSQMEDFSISLPHTREIQRYSGQSAQKRITSRLALVVAGNSTNISQMGNSAGRLVCNTGLSRSRSTSVCIKRCWGSGSSIHECVQQKLGLQSLMDFYSSISDSTSTEAT
ncbi:hypothetical protein JTB14_005731 [Gonioctena quinquepunctata]|nr:hypothetical protein JTB14_005731 [Gonioctena quinquepunctata]